MPIPDWSDDWGDWQYRNEEWEEWAEENISLDYLADTWDEHGVPPPSEWETVTPWIDSDNGTFGFEVVAGSEEYYIWTANDWGAWRGIWNELEDILPDVDWEKINYE